MAGVATVNLIGNLGRDPETGVTPNGAHFVKFSVAVSRKRGGEETTAWYAVTCWGALAQQIDDLAQQGAVAKGSQVFVSGRLEPREYEKDGQRRSSLDVNATEVQLVGGRREGGQPAATGVGPRDRDIEEIGF